MTNTLDLEYFAIQTAYTPKKWWQLHAGEYLVIRIYQLLPVRHGIYYCIWIGVVCYIVAPKFAKS